MSKDKGVWLGLQYLEEGEFTVRGGLGNKVLSELKVENGAVYVKDGNGSYSVIPIFKETI